MKSLLIRDTTREEREKIVADAILGASEGECDECSPGLERMYDAYIDGVCELREINMRFRSSYVMGKDHPATIGCMEGNSFNTDE